MFKTRNTRNIVSFKMRKKHMDSITEDYLKCKEGDKEAVIRLYNSMRNILLNVAFNVNGNLNDAEDIVHDVFVKVIQEEDEEKVKNAKLYLIRMTRNRAIDYLRKRKKEFDIDKSEVIIQTDSSEESVSFLFTNNLINRLPQPEAEIVRLRVVGELNFREIADILNISVANSFRLYKKGIRQLKILFLGQGEEK